MTCLRAVGILGLGVSLPERVMTNKDFEKMVDTSDEWIVTRTGIKERRFAAPDQATSDLAAAAALEALKMSNTKPEEIDLVIVASASPDMLFPATACIVQSKIGATRAGAFDLEAACSGFIYALTVGSQFIANGMYNRVLVIGAEALSRFLDFTDRNTCFLMGDGAGAAVLGPVEDGSGILALRVGADGAGSDMLKLPAGGSRMPATTDTVQARSHFISMNGREVFKVGVRQFEQSINEILVDAHMSAADVSLLVPHQANLRIIEAVAGRLHFPMDKVMVNLDKYGNMSSASIPVALYEAQKEGRIQKDDVIVLVAFGGGLTWGSAVIRWQ